MKARMYLWTCPFLLLLASCNSNDSTTVGALSGEPAGETSEPAPEGDVPENPLSSTPGGDTRAIAGLWNARSGHAGQIDERYVQITENGLYTEYDYRQDDLADDGNCYLRYGPLTLTPEDPATNAYSLPDDRYFSASRNQDSTILSIEFAEQSAEEWDLLSGVATDDLAGCANIQE